MKTLFRCFLPFVVQPKNVNPFTQKLHRISIVLACLVLLSFTASATTYTVTNLNDSGSGSFRQAIADANGADGNVIAFDPSLSGTITVGSLMYITKSVTINGNGKITLDGQSTYAIMAITDDAATVKSVIIRGLTFSKGKGNVAGVNGATTLVDFTAAQLYPAITSRESLTLESVNVTGCAGGVYCSSKAAAIGHPDFTLTNCKFTDNIGRAALATGSGPASDSFLGAITIDHCVFDNNSAGTGSSSGQIIQTGTSVVIKNSSFTNSTGTGYGAGLFIRTNSASMTSVLLENLTIANNTDALNGGGSLYFYIYFSTTSVTVNNCTIYGSNGGQLTPNNQPRQVYMNGSTTFTFNNCIIAGATDGGADYGAPGGGNTLTANFNNCVLGARNFFSGTGNDGAARGNVIAAAQINTTVDYYGGFVKTMPFTDGTSPAINLGLSSVMTSAVDARGFVRDFASSKVDAGSYERSAATFNYTGVSSPLNNTTNASTTGALTLTYGHAVTKGSGNIYVYNSANALLKTIAVSSSDVSISGSIVSIAAGSLPASTTVYVTADAGAFKATYDGVNATSTAISGSTAFTFTTTAPPPIVAPANQATNVNFTNTAQTGTTASWTNGNGSSRAAFIFKGSTGSPAPVNATTYTANTAYGSGTQIGSTGWYCVYNGTGSSVNITGLTSATAYRLMVVEYNDVTGSEKYLTSAGTNNPANVTSAASADATLADLSLSNGAILSPSFDATTTTYTSFVGNGVSSITITPTVSESHANIKVNGTAVASGAASGSIALNIGDNIITTVVTAQDGSTTKTYTTTVTRSDYPTPTNFASNLTFTNTTTSATTLSWTNGTGTSRAVFMTTGTTGNAQTANNSTYTANAAYGSGSTNSNGWYCVYNGTGSTVNISALNAGTDYRVRVVEYNGPAGYEKYIPVGGYANVTTVSNHTGINAIARNSAALTNGSSVQYTVSFDDNISGLTTDNFSLTGTASAATIASLSGSGKTYMVTVNAGGVDGTIVLNLANATGISPGIDTPLPYAGMTYTIDRTPPSATSAAFVSNNVLDHAHAKVGDVVTIAFTTTEPIQTPVISIAGHSVTPTNLNSSVSWAASYQLTSGDTEGNVHFSVNFNDLAGNAVNGGIPVTEANSGSILIFDKTAPAVNSISRQNPASVSTPANALTYRVTFTEPVLSVAKTAFTLNATGASAGTVSGVTQVSQTTYDVSVSGVSGAGTLRLDLKSAPTGITDLSGNAPTAGFTSGEAYTIQTAPSVITLAASNVGTTSATVNGTVNDNFDATIAGFQYNTSADFSGRPIGVATTGGSIAAGTGQTAAALTLTNLNPNTTYYYRITAGNNQGQTDGATLSFTTSPPPAVAPTQQAYALTFSGTTMSTTTVSWTSGNGAARAVFMSQTTNGSTAPANNTTYTANSNYGLGSQSPNSWYCVYNGTGSSVNISGLTPGATYRVHVVDYNGTSGGEKYLSSPAAPANVTTLQGAPATAATNVTFNSTTFTATNISWTNGNGIARAVFISQGNNGTAAAVDNISYTTNTNFGNGKQIGATGWYCIYNGSGTSASVTGLTPGLTYRVQVVEYNGVSGAEKYLTAPGTGNPANVTTPVTAPTIPAIQVTFNNITANSTNMSWTDGNGAYRAVFISQTNNGNTAPADNTTYTSNSTFGLGSQTPNGWYCIYSGTANTAMVTGLTSGVTYRVHVVEYNGNSGNEKYLTGNASPANVTTILSAPDVTLAATNVMFNTTSYTTTNVSWTNGGGSSRAVFISKSAVGTAAAVDGVSYTSNANFGNGKQIGATGWYCIYVGSGATNSASVTGLTPGLTYRVHVVEYNGTSGSEKYLNTAGTGNPANVTTPVTTPTIPAIQVTFNTTTSSSTNISWTDGNGASRAVFMIKANNGTTVPNDNMTYPASNTFGSGSVANGWYCIYNGTGSTATVSGLDPGTTYRVFVIEYNGSAGAEKYLTSSAAPANVTTVLTIPTIHATNLVFSNITTGTTTLTWASGNGTRRAVFLRQTASGTPTVSNGTTYNGNPAYTLGSPASPVDWYCIYNGSGNSVDITGLTSGNTYRATVVEYNGSGGSELYLSVASGSSPANVTTIATGPTVQALNLTFTNTTTNSTNVSWTSGNGEARAVFIAATGNGNPPVTNSATYSANTTFGAGTQAGGSGWYCVYNGTGSNTPIAGLNPNTQYRVAVVEYKGVPGAEQYLSTTLGGAPKNVTTVSDIPTIQTSNIVLSGTNNATNTISWSNGNGVARLVFIAPFRNSGSPTVTAGHTYTANTAVYSGSASDNGGWFCIYNGVGSSTPVTGLVGNTMYRIAVVEYFGSTGTEKYQAPTGAALKNVTTTGAGGFSFNGGSDLLTLISFDNNSEALQAPEPANILSPNGDGKNDTWNIKHIDQYPTNTVTVTDRSGKTLFSQKGYNNDWSGTANGSTLNEGTYYYTLDPGNGAAVIKGFITVVKDK